MAKRRIWLSYDLGLRGDYQSLYRMLDNLKAVEIGNSAATFEYETPDFDDESLLNSLKKEIESYLDVDRNTRIYVIRAIKNGVDIQNVRGTFLYGKRKSSPWEGCGDRDDTKDDE